MKIDFIKDWLTNLVNLVFERSLLNNHCSTLNPFFVVAVKMVAGRNIERNSVQQNNYTNASAYIMANTMMTPIARNENPKIFTVLVSSGESAGSR